LVIKAHDNEQELLVQLRLDSKEAFTTLYIHYSGQLYHNVLSMVKDEGHAEEFVQDIFSEIWQKRASVNIRTGFGPYLFAVSRNRVYDFFRELRRNKELYARIRNNAFENHTTPEEPLQSEQNFDLLEKAIATLPPQRRKAFVLCKLNGLSYQEASEQMGVSLSTIKDHMANARDNVKKYVRNNRGIVTTLGFLLSFRF